MKDIVPELLEKIKQEFQERLSKSEIVKRIERLIQEGKATYAEAHEYAVEVGSLLADTFKNNISADVLLDGKMYYNIADRILNTTLGKNHEIISTVTAKIQTDLNQSAGIGIKGIQAPINQDRIDGLIERISNEESFDDVSWILDEPVVNFSQSVVDETIKTNAKFHEDSGLQPKIIRKSTRKCCDWCNKRVGTYNYKDVSDTGNEVFRRHRFCRCTVEYDPRNGKRRNVHTHKDSGSKEDKEAKQKLREKQIELQKKDQEKAQKRKQRLKEISGLAGQIEENPKILGEKTPAEWKKALEKAGYTVTPLKKGSLTGVTFEDGGGFSVVYGGDRYVQYHPGNTRRHDGPYYKTSSGPRGARRFDLSGETKT